MRKDKTTLVHIDFLSISIWITFTDDIVGARNKLLHKYPKLSKLDPDPDTGGLHTSYYGEYPRFHWLHLNHKPKIYTVNHEIQHCVDQITEYFGFTDTEFRAYLFEFISKRIFGDKTV